MAQSLHYFLCLCLSLCLWVTPAQAASAAGKSAAAAEHFVVGQKMHGISAWYGLTAHGKGTASGKTFDSTALTAAHRTLPFGTMVKVTNKKNNKSTIVEVTDRGPRSKKLIIDISRQAATNIGMLKHGTAAVSLEILSLPASYRTKKPPQKKSSKDRKEPTPKDRK